MNQKEVTAVFERVNKALVDGLRVLLDTYGPGCEVVVPVSESEGGGYVFLTRSNKGFILGFGYQSEPNHSKAVCECSASRKAIVLTYLPHLAEKLQAENDKRVKSCEAALALTERWMNQ